MTAAERRSQAVLQSVEARILQLELDHSLERAVIDHLFDTSRVAFLRGAYDAGFIQRLIAMTPALTEKQQTELSRIADDLLQFARQQVNEAHENGRRQLAADGGTGREPDLVDRFTRWLRGGETAHRASRRTLRERDFVDDFFDWLR